MHGRSLGFLITMSSLAWLVGACGDDDDPVCPSTTTGSSGAGGSGAHDGGGGSGGAVVPTYAVSVAVQGLWGKLGLTLSPTGEALEIDGDGTHRFMQPLADGTSFSLTASAPPLQTCTVDADSGVIDGADATLSISCASHLVFAGQQSQGDVELFATDGTEVGTRQIADIRPQGGSNPYGITLGPRGQVFFLADDGTSGREVWVSDGSATGTRMLIELGPGANDANVYDMVSFGQELLFSAASPSAPNDVELWATDGTTEGTAVRFDLRAGNEGSYPYGFVVSGARLFFQASIDNVEDRLFVIEGGSVSDLGLAWDGDGVAGPQGTLFDTKFDGVIGRELYRSDGTAATTGLVADLNPNGSSSPNGMIVLGDRMLFSADDGTHGFELFEVSQGTASLVVDIVPGAGDSSPETLGTVGDRMVFSAVDGTHGRELWITDGTAAGTSLLADVTAGAGGSGFRWLGDLGGALLVSAWPDGQPALTKLLRVEPAGITELYDPPADYFLGFDVGEALGQPCFTVLSNATGYELWCSDGTPAGTRQVIELCPGACGGVATSG